MVFVSKYAIAEDLGKFGEAVVVPAVVLRTGSLVSSRPLFCTRVSQTCTAWID